MDTMRRAYHGKGGGGGGGGGGRRLERRNATKHISYDSHSRKPRRSLDSDQSSYDESESSSHSREDWSLDEYRVLGSSSVEEMSNVCRYLGLPGPASLGIGREAWESAKWHNSTGAAGGDSMFSGTQEDPPDFTFVVSPPPSNAPTSPQESFRYPHGRGKDVAFDHEVGDDGLSTSPSKHRNDADAADVANFIEEHREQEQQSHRLLPLWRNRSTSMPATQSRPMSPPRNSVVSEGSHKTSLLGSKIFHYPDPTMHILRARSQPVLPSAMSPGSGEAHAVREEKSNYNTSQTRSLPSSAVTKSPVDQHGSRDRSTDPALVTSREVPMPRLVDSSSRSSSSSDGSGEFINREPAVHARADKVVPEQRSSEKKQDVGREQAVAAFRPGSLSKPPPRSVLYLPPDAFSTHDLLSSLGPSDASVEVVGKRDSQSDSEDDERPEDSASGQYSPSPVSSKSLRENADVARPVEEIHSPQDPVFEVRDLSSAVQIVVKSTGNTDVDARAPRDEGKDTSEDRPSEIESNGAERSSGVDVQEATTSPTEDVLPIDPTQSPVPAEGGTHDLRPLADDEMRVQTVTDPWSKGDLLGAGSFGTVYEAVDSNGSFFAVKEVSLTDTDRNSQQCISQLEQEIELLSRFKHDNIVQYLGTQRADGKLYIFLELVSKGSLASLCKKFKLTHSQIVAYTRQILKGLKYLHDMNIVHRDIKCANILVDVKGTCKLADFGLAKQISAFDQLKCCKGSAYWMAPEVIDPKKTYWLPADIWSLGCSVIEMFTGSPPSGDQEWYRVLRKVGDGEAPPIPEELSDDAKDFIQQCLEVNPSRRPTAAVLLQHKFVASSMGQTNSGQLNRQMVVSSLGTITEEIDSLVSFSNCDTYFKNEVEESSLERDPVPVCVHSMLRAEKVLATPKQDFLPVAKRTLPVVINLEAAANQAMEATYYRSHVLEDTKEPVSIKAASGSPVEEQGEKCSDDGDLAKDKFNGGGLLPIEDFPPASCMRAEKRLHGGGLENWDRPEVIRSTLAMMTGDIAQNTHVVVAGLDGKDPSKTHCLKSTMLIAAEDPHQSMANHEGNAKKKMPATVEAAGSSPTVVVKKKLQTKRKKVAVELEKKPTEAASLDPVPSDSQRAEATTTRAANVAMEDVEINGPEEIVGVLDNTSVSPTLPETSAADKAMVLWAPKADGVVEGSPTDLVNGGQSQALALRCNCGKPAVLKTVGYKSQNRGKRYYSCEKFQSTFFTRKRNRKHEDENLPSCRFFQWLDVPRVTMEDKKDIRLQKRRLLEQILAGKSVTTNYTTRSSSKQELSDHDTHRNQGLIEGVPPVSGLSVEEPKHEDSEDPEPSSKKQKLNKMDLSLSTADSVAFSTRASAARKRKGPCVADTNVDRSTSGNSSCGDESSHEVSVGDCNNSHPRKAAKRVKPEVGNKDTRGHTYTRRGESSRPPRQSCYTPRAKNIGRMERATADTHHVRKLLPVALAYEKSREVILEEISEEEVSGDPKEDSDEEKYSVEVCSEEEDRVDTPGFTSAERQQTPVKPRSQRASSTPRSGQNGKLTKAGRKIEDSRRNVQKVCRDATGSETSLSGDLHKGTKYFPQWIEVPLTSPFEDKDSSKSGVSGHHVAQHGVGQYSPFAGSDDLVVNFPTASQSGEKRTISSNTLQLVKEKAREAVNLKRGKSPTSETESQKAAWTKPAEQMRRRSAEHKSVSDSDEEETGPSGSRGLRSLKDMLKRENSDGTTSDYEVADESQPPYCECKTVKRRAALKTVLSNSANQGLRYWVCVNHRPLFQRKSLWEGDPNDESCKFFRWLDTPIISYAERKKQMAARRRRNERKRR